MPSFCTIVLLAALMVAIAGLAAVRYLSGRGMGGGRPIAGVRLTCAKSGPLSADGDSKNRLGSRNPLKAAVRSPKADIVHSYSGIEISAASGNVRLYGRPRHIGSSGGYDASHAGVSMIEDSRFAVWFTLQWRLVCRLRVFEGADARPGGR